MCLDKGKRRIFLAIFVANLLSTFGDAMPASFQPLFFASLGISAAAIGLVYNIRNIVQTIIRAPIGSMSDRLGRKRLMLIGLFMLALTPFIYSVSHDTFLPLLAMLISGFGISLYYPPSEAYASNLYPPENVGEAMGRFHLGWAISSIIGPFVGGLLTSVLPSYRYIFQLASFITLASVVVIFFYAKDESNISLGGASNEVGRTLREFPSTIVRQLKNRRVMVASITIFSHSFCNSGISTFFPLFAAGLGFNELMIGVSLTLNALLMGIALPFMGIVSDRIGRLTPIVLGLTVSIIGFAFIPIFTGAEGLVFFMAMIGLGAALVFPVSQVTIFDALPENERGAGTGLWGTVMSLGGTIGMFVMSFIVSISSLEWVFYFSAAFTLASLVLILIMRGYFKA